jgi:GMP synthase (glutamine-hydrolysing)
MIVIVDNGSQYTHLIKRNMRDLGKETAIVQNREEVKGQRLIEVAALNPKAIILSGGPSSVTVGDNGVSAQIIQKVWNKEGGLGEIPLLGICYGHQLLAYELGGRVGKGASAEYGLGRVFVDEEDTLFKGVPSEFTAWVSHFDEVKETPKGFVPLAHSKTCTVEAMRHSERKIFGLQFHPEVWHTENGERILENFLSSIES